LTDTNIYLAYGRPVTRQQWVEGIAADLAAPTVRFNWRIPPVDSNSFRCAPTVAEFAAALVRLRDIYAAAEAAAAH